MFMNPTIGADPELFVRNNGRFVTAEGLIEGEKRQPAYVEDPDSKRDRWGYREELGRMQVDGVAAEFNTKVFQLDGRRKAEFVGNVVRIHKVIGDKIRKQKGYADAELVAVPTADFDLEYFKGLSEQSKELGCDPDFSGYDGMANRRPNNEVTYRTGSGHVHVGWSSNDGQMWDIGDNDHYEKCMAMAVEMDFYLGVPSLLWDADARRRSLYGRAGAFRPKPYGMEYRVLSNVWVGDPKLIGYVYSQTRSMVENFEKMKYFDKFGGLAADIINNSDVEQAKAWMKDVGMPYPEI